MRVDREGAFSSGPLQAFPYRGGSMHGTFQPGDLLFVQPVSLAEARPGDVIAFRQAQADGGTVHLVHRAQARVEAGLITRGDCSAIADATPVGAAELLGRVVAFQRQGRLRRVWGGPVGRLWVSWLRLRRLVLRLAYFPYGLLRASGLVRRLWRPRLEQVHLLTEEGPLVKFVHGRRTVACWYPADGRFWCRKPYDLVIEPPGAGD